RPPPPELSTLSLHDALPIFEAALEEHPLVRSACVIGMPDEDLGSIPHAIVEADATVTDEELVAHLRQRLSSYKLPRTFERVAARSEEHTSELQSRGHLVCRL